VSKKSQVLNQCIYTSSKKSKRYSFFVTDKLEIKNKEKLSALRKTEIKHYLTINKKKSGILLICWSRSLVSNFKIETKNDASVKYDFDVTIGFPNFEKFGVGVESSAHLCRMHHR